ncbi:gephyrin-like molybdotransferase Glp [Natronoglomus mannanivorans]|uniref:Molybdopterin molybdotransferase MoeA n=1 Tax=Natronoglomus mannanivorans TaxID=2979990 RepID=A0AAP2Z1W8_9EURY|nr:molybdopterin molybdotransferase MoeA [Halobacteria archaeon AArc-xg1-1]
MKGADRDRTESGFKSRTRLADARAILEAAVSSGAGGGGDESESESAGDGDGESEPEPEPEPERLGLGSADGRVLAEAVRATRNVPHYRRAAMDGYAVRAADTFGASARSPAVLEVVDLEDDATGTEPVGPDTAARIHTGSELPTGADAVVMIEHADVLEFESKADVEITDAVAVGENVAPIGEDVEEGQVLFEAGHRLRPSDLGLLRSVGVSNVAVRPKPTVGVVPTGEELVHRDPEPGEIVETNGLTVSQLVERWGGRATYRDVVTDDRDALRVAIQRDLTKDVVVTTGGSSVGERDLLPEVIDDLGEVLVHGVAIKPGYPVALGIVEDTPVLALPGYPVACIVTAVQFLRPLLRRLEGASVSSDPHPTTEARLERKIPSDIGSRTFARVRVEERNGAGEQVATPTRTSGAGVLSSVALADGWVVVEESLEGIPAGETVTVEHWEAHL